MSSEVSDKHKQGGRDREPGEGSSSFRQVPEGAGGCAIQQWGAGRKIQAGTNTGQAENALSPKGKRTFPSHCIFRVLL